jgi:hypothetical protein
MPRDDRNAGVSGKAGFGLNSCDAAIPLLGIGAASPNGEKGWLAAV